MVTIKNLGIIIRLNKSRNTWFGEYYEEDTHFWSQKKRWQLQIPFLKTYIIIKLFKRYDFDLESDFESLNEIPQDIPRYRVRAGVAAGFLPSTGSVDKGSGIKNIRENKGFKRNVTC